MKQIAFGAVCMLLLMMIVWGVVTMSHRTLRESEMENSLADTVQSVLEDMVQSQEYDLTDEDALAAAFYESLLHKINAGEEENEDPGFELTADITGIDADKGVLSVHVTEKYTKPNGKIGEVECHATASFDAKKTAGTYTVWFYVLDDLWHCYEITEGEEFVLPPDPVMEEMEFRFWSSDPEEETEAVFPSVVTEDLSYFAVFEEKGENR